MNKTPEFSQKQMEKWSQARNAIQSWIKTPPTKSGAPSPKSPRVMAVIYGLLSLFLLLGIEMLLSPDTLGTGIFITIVSVVFGYASYQCTKASQK